MKITIDFKQAKYQVNLSEGMDISIPLKDGFDNPNCFYAPAPVFEPVRAGDFVGATLEGGCVNFKNVRFNPHGNGTHTECVGHIAKEVFMLNDVMKLFHFMAKLVTIYPTLLENGDRVILKNQIAEVLNTVDEVSALVLRTMPNDTLKTKTNYSNANPPYIEEAAMQYIVACGIEHFLTDLPSVDREEDGGALLSHNAFWQYPNDIRTSATISEMVYVPNEIRDAYYFLNIQIASFDLDVSPSKPVLYKITF
jgi:kynurenine formamidase